MRIHGNRVRQAKMESQGLSFHYLNSYLLDTSGSMAGAPIAELNAGLVTFKDELAADALAMKRVEVAIITFGPVKVENDFHTVSNFFPPNLCVSGDTPMGAAIKQGLEMIKQRKEEYRTNGIS